MPERLFEDISFWKFIWSGLLVIAGAVGSAAFFLGKQEVQLKKMQADIKENEENLKKCKSDVLEAVKQLTPITWCQNQQASCKEFQKAELGHGKDRFVAIEANVKELSSEIIKSRDEYSKQVSSLKDFIQQEFNRR